MQKGPCGLAAAAVVALAACTPSTEKPTADDAAPDIAEARHVDFEPGATVMVLAGELGTGQTARYILGAHEGDLLMAHALSPGEDMRVSVHRLDEEAPLPDAVEAGSYWVGRLPATCGYLVEVEGAGSVGPFNLELELPRHLPLAPGISRVTLEGTIRPHAPLAFVGTIEEGRTLSASVTSPGDAVSLVIHGAADGHSLAGWESTTSDFSGAVPRTQDHVFRLDPGAEQSTFALSVSVK